MNRRLLCAACGERYRVGRYQLLAPSAIGKPAEWVRGVRGVARVPQPDQRVVYLNGAPEPLAGDHYDCDSCGDEIHPGDPCTAVTLWIPARQPEPTPWEDAYLTTEDMNHASSR